jgi:hypothetical protein
MEELGKKQKNSRLYCDSESVIHCNISLLRAHVIDLFFEDTCASDPVIVHGYLFRLWIFMMMLMVVINVI